MTDKLSFRCIGCDRKLSVLAEHAGRKVRCPDCGTVQAAGPTQSKSPIDSSKVTSSRTRGLAAEGGATGHGLPHASPAVVNPSRSGVGHELPSARREVEPDRNFKFDAFISYRHAPMDRRWAKWLHTALETYRVPKSLVQERGVKRRLNRVFRDEEELSASSSLSQVIDEALESSRYLIVVCSPRTPASEWVNQEVKRFRELGRHDRILSLLIEGEPRESFPKSLREIRRTIVDAKGLATDQLEQVEPLAADVRPTRSKRSLYLRRMARMRLVATILSCDLDELIQRERQRHRRRLATWAVVASASLAVIVALLVSTSRQVNLFQQIASQAQGSAASAEQKRLLAEQQATDAQRRQAEATRLAEQARLDKEAQEASLRELERRSELESLKMAQKVRVAEYSRQIAQAQHAFEADQLELAQSILEQCPRELRNFEHAYLLNCTHQKTGGVLPSERVPRPSGDTAWLFANALSEDGSRMAVPEDECITVRETERGIEQLQLAFEGRVNCRFGQAAFTVDGQRLAAVLPPADRSTQPDIATIVAWNLNSRQLIHSFETPASTFSTWLAPDGTHVATALGKTVTVWQVMDGQSVRELNAAGTVMDAAWSPDGMMLATSCTEKRWEQSDVKDVPIIELWQLPSGKHIRLAGLTKRADFLAFDPNGSCLLGANQVEREGRRVSQVILWDLPSGAIRTQSLGPSTTLSGVAFSPDSKRIATTWRDRTVRVWDTVTGTELLRLALQEGINASRVAFSPNGKVLGVGTWNCELWRATGHHPVTIPVEGSVTFASFHPHLDKVLIGSMQEFAAWDLKWITQSIKIPIASEECFAVAPTGTIVASSHYKHGIRFWSVDSGENIGTIEINHTATSLSFSPDGQRLASGHRDHRVRTWDVPSKRLLKTLEESTFTGESVRWFPDGKRILALDSSKEVIDLWDAESGRRQRRIELGDINSSRRVCLAPSGEQFAYVDFGDAKKRTDRAIVIATVNSTREIVRLPIAFDVKSVAFSPDGTLLAVGGYDIAGVWDLRSGRELATFALEGEVATVAFDPKGHRFAAGHRNGLTIWDLEAIENSEEPE